MSFNNWLSLSSSSSTTRQPVSTTTRTNIDEMKSDNHHHYYHHHYHYHYAPMTTSTTTAIIHPLHTHCHQQHNISNTIALVPSMPMIDQQIQLKNKENLRQNSTLKLRRCVALFLHLIDHSSIVDFLQYDKHFRHADKYLLAMTLIYFWRAKLREHYFTKDSFYLALWLAHDSVEEDLTAKYGLLPWALQTNDGRPSVDLKNDFKRFLTKKNDLWTRLGFRARVSKDECDEIMLIQPNHWIWQRERSNNYNQNMATLNRREKIGVINTEDSCSSSSSSLSISSVDDAKKSIPRHSYRSMMIVNNINADKISWTNKKEIDEIIILD